MLFHVHNPLPQGTVVLWVICDVRYSKPISVARQVLDHPTLSMVVGNGATEFAANWGFALEENNTLLSDKTMKAYKVCVHS